MTCIVGAVERGRVFIGGDSAGVQSWDLTIRADQKVWAAGGWAFGFTSSFRMGQLLRWAFTPPPMTKGPLERYLATEFMDAVRTTLKDGGYAKVESGRDEGGEFLVGHQGRLFVVHSDFQVSEPAAGLAAIGCGGSLALGALHALPKSRGARARVRASLGVAERLSAGVAGPFKVVSA